MEASAAGLAASGDATQGSDTQGTDQGQQDQGRQEISELSKQLQGLSTGQEEMREFLQSNPWAPPAEAEPEPAPDLGFLDENNPNYDPEQAAQKLQQFMREQGKTAADEQLKSELEPLRAEIQTLRSERAADSLASEFPEMKDPEVAQQVIDTAEKYAEMLENPGLVGNFDFIRLTYMAGRAAQMQAEGRDEQPTAATLEGAGGASPGVTQGDITTDSVTATWGKANSLFGAR